MKHIAPLLGAAFATLLAGEVAAQDAWAGWYGGLSLNHTDSDTFISGSDTHSFDVETGSLGFFGGFNKVRPGGLVWGPEVAITSLGETKSATDATFGTSNAKGGMVVTTKLRAGYATEKLYVYGFAGLGITGGAVRPQGATGEVLTISPAYGLGVEMAVADQWTARLEATVHDFGGPDYSFGGTNTATGIEATTVSIGLARRF
ncbi:MAG: outer membrane protein [Paracoccaceae bacterium]